MSPSRLSVRRLRPPGIPFHVVAGMDRRIVRAVAAMPAGPWDGAFSWLTRAATRSVLWIAIAAGLSTRKGPPRRAAAHGLLAVAVASAGVNLIAKRLLPRTRPHPESLPAHRFLHPQPTSSSLPSGHSASAVAFAAGVGMVSPTLGAALAPLAAGVAYSRVHTGAHWPSDVVLGSALGAGAAFATRTWWPRQEAAPEPSSTPAPAPALEGGEGLVIVVNPLSGSTEESVRSSLATLFPRAEVHELREDEDAVEAGRALAARPGVQALGVWGGDGTVGAIAGVCAETRLPLVVLPGGTFNHFARDVGALEPDEVAEAVGAGHAIRCDLGRVRVERGALEKPDVSHAVMLNTGSIGVYPNLVRRRDHLLRRFPALGKRGAAALAALATFSASTPTRLAVDGGRHRLWILFIGRGRYWPRDLAPLERPIVDDGVLDLRAIGAGPRFARLRVLGAVATGTTEKSPVTHMWEAGTLDVAARKGALILAVDGEVIPGVRRATITVEPGALTVYSPRGAGPDQAE
ncbi:bifunctional phosphatase PAP2/diacylglycerol kinase family protein [Sinomonas sp. B1-1]|uniref:bifunctional phosphatase PAP2/diacylglycerol kinase family protein n=1 Tax=Sinomonas sp. B1-1 TaxID=3141454 RepID=UPI003D2967E0